MQKNKTIFYHLFAPPSFLYSIYLVRCFSHYFGFHFDTWLSSAVPRESNFTPTATDSRSIESYYYVYCLVTGQTFNISKPKKVLFFPRIIINATQLGIYLVLHKWTLNKISCDQKLILPHRKVKQHG